MTPDTTAAKLHEGESIESGDELRAVVTLEGSTVVSTDSGRCVLFPDLSPAALGLRESAAIGIRCVVQKPIYGPHGAVDFVFVDEIVETIDPNDFHNTNTDARNESTASVARTESTKSQSVSKQRVRKSRKQPRQSVNPNLMRNLVQGSQ
ncbi:hypothetical protein [Natronorubrum sp. A-ect3]|uniref:hypothetical protein n=1 Tax=Natronorubrum sp. A-ect3 TaxID=3242698 RepID=UPI00359DFFAF